MYLHLECPKCGKRRYECECPSMVEQRAITEEKESPDFWRHNCPDSGWTDTLLGEDCNWCDAKSPVIDEEDDSNPNSVGYYGFNEKTDNYYPEIDD